MVPRHCKGKRAHTSCIVRDDGHKIIGDNGHCVTINAELLSSFGTSVDQTQSMHLSRTKSEIGNASVAFAFRLITWGDFSAVKIIFPVDEIIIRSRPLALLACIVPCYTASGIMLDQLTTLVTSFPTTFVTIDRYSG